MIGELLDRLIEVKKEIDKKHKEDYYTVELLEEQDNLINEINKLWYQMKKNQSKK